MLYYTAAFTKRYTNFCIGVYTVGFQQFAVQNSKANTISTWYYRHYYNMSKLRSVLLIFQNYMFRLVLGHLLVLFEYMEEDSFIHQ